MEALILILCAWLAILFLEAGYSFVWSAGRRSSLQAPPSRGSRVGMV